MRALIETIGPMLLARTEMASRSNHTREQAIRLNELVNVLDPAIHVYYDDVRDARRLPIL